MKTRLLKINLLLIGIFTLSPASALFDGKILSLQDELNMVRQNLQHALPGEVLIKFKNNSPALLPVASGRYNLEFLKQRSNNISSFRLGSGQNILKTLSALNQDPNVEYAEPNYRAYAFSVPNDPFYKYQWNFQDDTFDVEKIWKISTGKGAVVAVVDTGIAYEDYFFYKQAPDLENTVFVPGYNFVQNSTHANDENRHGTHVTGTISQSTDNGEGVVGLAPDAMIMPVKVLDKNGSGNYGDVADGIVWAVDHGAHIINLSLGGPAPAKTLEQALKYAYERDVLVVTATGNNGANEISYPARYSQYALSVGAVDASNNVTGYSNRGEGIDLVAYGGDLSKDYDNDGYKDGILQQTLAGSPKKFGYYFLQGTSMATPHVAAAAALLVETGVSGAQNLKDRLTQTATDLYSRGYDYSTGHGLVNPLDALLNAESQAQISQPKTEQDEPPVQENLPPTAKINIPQTAFAGQDIEFRADDSFDPDGYIKSYQWTFGDGHESNKFRLQHSYSQPGNYQITLKVTDSDGATAFATQNMEVVEMSKKSMNIGSINISVEKSFIRARARVFVQVTDELGKPVNQAEVSGSWTGNASGATVRLTNSQGIAEFLSRWSFRRSGFISFSVDNIQVDDEIADWTYNSSKNSENFVKVYY